MKVTIELDAAEACAAAYDYLVKRGSLPKHGTVMAVSADPDSNRYGAATIKVTAEIKEPEVVPPPTPSEEPCR